MYRRFGKLIKTSFALLGNNFGFRSEVANIVIISFAIRAILAFVVRLIILG